MIVILGALFCSDSKWSNLTPDNSDCTEFNICVNCIWSYLLDARLLAKLYGVERKREKNLVLCRVAVWGRKDLLLSETVMAEPCDTRCEQPTGTDKDQRDYSGPFVQRPTVSRHSLTLMNFDIVQLKWASGRQCLISIPGVETRNLGITWVTHLPSSDVFFSFAKQTTLSRLKCGGKHIL